MQLVDFRFIVIARELPLGVLLRINRRFRSTFESEELCSGSSYLSWASTEGIGQEYD